MDWDNPKLKLLDNDSLVDVYDFPFTIGRALTNRLVIENRAISRIHCVINKQDKQFVFEDKSTNGTLINNQLYRKERTKALEHGDVITLNPEGLVYKFLLREDQAEPAVEDSAKPNRLQEVKNEERKTDSPSLSENGISDEMLCILADNILKDVEKPTEAEPVEIPSTRDDRNLPGPSTCSPVPELPASCDSSSSGTIIDLCTPSLESPTLRSVRDDHRYACEGPPGSPTAPASSSEVPDAPVGVRTRSKSKASSSNESKAVPSPKNKHKKVKVEEMLPGSRQTEADSTSVAATTVLPCNFDSLPGPSGTQRPRSSSNARPVSAYADGEDDKTTGRGAASSEDTVVGERSDGAETRQYEEMENELQCAICSELFVKATTLNCSHTFCRHCIEMWRRNKAECPICRQRIKSASHTLVLDNVVKMMVENSGREVQELRRQVVEERERTDRAAAEAEAARSAGIGAWAGGSGGERGRGAERARRDRHGRQ